MPDLAYVAELLPSKKPHEFSVQNFRQINGKFLDDNQLLEENVVKLVGKLEEDEYSLILPDYLFTNTIVNVNESSEAKVKTHLKEKLLPDLGLKDDTHLVQSFILTQHKGVYKVQLSALEKSVLDPIKTALAKSKVKVKTVHPLSWTVKSLISLEPSISLVQMGDRVYLALQYIGVDQTNSEAVADVESLVETIKTLKGAERSIQTIYLASSELVEEKLKEGLKEILPIQQLASFKDEDKMPSYVKKVIESGMKSLAIEDYQVPKFELGKIEAKTADKDKEKKEDVTEKTDAEDLEAPAVIGSDLPKPTALAGEDLDTEEKKEEEPTPETTSESLDDEAKPEEEVKTEEKVEEKDEIADIVESLGEEDKEEDKKEPEVEKEEVKEEKKEEEKKEEVSTDIGEVDLSQFVQSSTDEDKDKKEEVTMTEEKKPEKKVIKNKSGLGGMLKMLFIGLASFSITVAIGVGIGLGVLSVANKGDSDVSSPFVEEVVEEVSPEPEVTATPTPEPVAEIDKKGLKVLVVNATTVSGYAGKIKTKLESAGFENVTAKNAKGNYDESNYLLMAEENKSILTVIGEDTGLDFEYSDEKDVEDSAEAYDVVVVLATDEEPAEEEAEASEEE